MTGSLPDDSEQRNRYPMADGLLDYFPNALALVSEVSKIGGQQHNPGEPMYWARWKSPDHANKIMRHLADRGKKDSKGVRHSAYLAWRALANLQIECEEQDGVPLPRGARLAEYVPEPHIDLAQPESAATAAVEALMPPGTPPNEIGD